MNHDEQALDFSTVIASTVHDMKNSLAMLMQAHSQWLARLPDAQRQGTEQGVIDFEFAHLNGMLVQLLGLYKLGVNQMPLQPAYHELDDFIEAQLAAHQEVFASRGIIATYEVDPLSPLGFFDRELVASVLGNCINNAIRYARESLLITVSDEAGQLVGGLVVFTDITARRFAEELVRDQERVLELIAYGVPLPQSLEAIVGLIVILLKGLQLSFH